LSASLLARAASSDPRRVLALDGVWQIADGTMDRIPATFDRTVPVPGLVSLARPPFPAPPGPKVADRKQVPQKDPARDAFWYRRTFHLDQPVPAVATLMVRKAMFGTRVLLNGRLLGDHLPSFTSGCFDARPALRPGLNEILIRVGADRDAVGPAIPAGFDYEKDRYIPGIFDSVELVLSGSPHFTQLQIAPDLPGQAARVQAVLRNVTDSGTATVRFVVREARSGRIAGRLALPNVHLDHGQETNIDLRIPLANMRLWSPEDPFLYALEADSGADRVRTRFGMREFRFDPGTGQAILNGKPYPLRGSNFTVYRFFEDDQCRDLPWRSAWVRKLHQRVKEMHWNSLRYCIGFPPEAWYDVADELGILIQDEFPLWHGGPGWGTWPKELTGQQLAIEYTEWLKDRWNHPCVVLWDANNETTSDQATLAIRAVRGLDLSSRPWDNSYSPPMEPGDVFESHPYHFNANFRLRNLATADRVPQGNAIPNDRKHAVIINEYGWHWVNRDGTPTTLTRDIYKNVLGENATPAQRFHLQATWLAADTDFWRMSRHAAGVLHFTTLGYSRPDGQTCDHWRDVARLVWEPEFLRYVRDAFAPVGLAIDFWPDQVFPGAEARIPVRLVNDLDRPWSGAVSLRLTPAGAKTPRPPRDLSQTTQMEALGLATLDFNLAWPTNLGRYTLEASLRGVDRKTVRSVREIEVIDPKTLGLAYLRPATASSIHSAPYAPANAVDGNPGTYWSSTFADPAWFAVDLGAPQRVSHVRILWQTAFSKAFSVQTSTDAQIWTDVYTTAEGKGGTSEIHFAPVQTRWIRLNCTRRGTEWGHAVLEMSVFE
jgi:hypothetical protein